LRSVHGGKRYVMEVLAPSAMQFERRLERPVARWMQLTPWQRRFVTLDDLAADAGLTPAEFLGAVVRAAFEFTGSMTDLIVASAFPRIVQACATRATTPSGIEDRMVLMQYVQTWADRQAVVDQPREQTFTEKILAAANGAPETASTDAAMPSTERHPSPQDRRSPLGSIH
jgi:hypothetical protein